MTTEDLIIDVSTLSTWLEKKKPVTVLDVRPKAEREQNGPFPEVFTLTFMTNSKREIQMSSIKLR